MKTPLLFAVGLLLSQITPAPKEAKPTLQEQIDELKTTVNFHDIQISALYDRTAPSTTDVDCNGRGFHFVRDTDNPIVFLVVCDKIEPYLEGYRVTLRFGNLSAFVFSGAKGVVTHGETTVKSWSQKVPFLITGEILPGKWATIDVAITPVTAKDVRVVGISEFKIDKLHAQ